MDWLLLLSIAFGVAAFVVGALAIALIRGAGWSHKCQRTGRDELLPRRLRCCPLCKTCR